MKLLPDDVRREMGFTAYVWLVYGIPFVVEPFLRGGSAVEIAATLAGGAAFVVLYFAGYHLRGHAQLSVVAGFVLLAVGFVPFNGGAASFFVYAAAHGSWARSPRYAAVVIAAVVAILGVTAVVFRLPTPVWASALVFSVLIGAVNAHFGEVARKNATLRAARAEVQRLAQVAERERIARDLHDLLGHTLSVIVLKSELASKLATRDVDAALREIRDVERISRQALQEVRAAVTGYRARISEEMERARQALAAAGVAFEPDVEPLPLTGEQEGVLALALREAVTNVVRHAQARHCRIRLGARQGRARLVVEDDGRGGVAPEGAGLASMRERVAAIGGVVERGGDGGTRLVVSVPLEAAS